MQSAKDLLRFVTETSSGLSLSKESGSSEPGKSILIPILPVLGGVDGGVSNLSSIGDVSAVVFVSPSREVRVDAQVASLNTSTISSSLKSSDEACKPTGMAVGSLSLRNLWVREG
jgi:hypothetical protein